MVFVWTQSISGLAVRRGFWVVLGSYEAVKQAPFIRPHMLLILCKGRGNESLGVTGHSVMVMALHIPPPRACSGRVLHQLDTAHWDLPRWLVHRVLLTPPQGCSYLRQSS